MLIKKNPMPLFISSIDATIRVKRAFHPAPASRDFASHVFLVTNALRLVSTDNAMQTFTHQLLCMPVPSPIMLLSVCIKWNKFNLNSPAASTTSKAIANKRFMFEIWTKNYTLGWDKKVTSASNLVITTALSLTLCQFIDNRQVPNNLWLVEWWIFFLQVRSNRQDKMLKTEKWHIMIKFNLWPSTGKREKGESGWDTRATTQHAKACHNQICAY